MKKAEIKVGGLYSARVSGRYVTVRVDSIREQERGYPNTRECTVYDVTNLTTGRKTTFRSAAKFRGIAKDPAEGAGRLLKAMTGAATVQDAIDISLDHSDQPGVEVEETAPDGTPVTEGDDSSDPTDSVDAQVAVDPAPATVPASPLAAMIAASHAGSSIRLTEEQEAIIEVAKQLQAAMRGLGVSIELRKVNGQWVLVIGAGAGTGKTFTLKQLELTLEGIGQYTAFNKPIVVDSKRKFTKISCDTTHSLAFRAIGRRFAHRLNGQRVRSWEIAARLGIEDFYVELPETVAPPETMPDGTEKPQVRRLKAGFLAGQVTEAIRRFCQSADAELGTKHFHKFDGLDEAGSYRNSDKVKSYLLPFAQRAWADLSSEAGSLPFSHDHYVKLWQLGTGKDRPYIAADYILLDEAQDTAPVMLSILQQQTHALLILVGDDNQQIYEWRGAVNAMASFPGAPRRLLSQSFRFGQAVADVANSVLATLDDPTDLVMRGQPTIPTRVCEVAKPRCYLYRTNAGALGRLMAGMDAGQRGHLIGGSKETVAFCRAAIDLQAKRGTSHNELGCFTTWAEVQEYSQEDEGADLRLMVKLIDEFTAERIIKAVENMPPEEQADFVVCTAHKSKGREWTTVRLGQDFPLANKLTDADRRLVYVAATRAQEELDLTVCPTFAGGYDRKGGGEDGEGPAGGEWVPGIEVEYTAPMPSAEDLAAYRAAKSAPATPAAAPAAAQVVPIVQPAPVAAAANVATANGLSTAAPEFSWANLDGQWLVRGPADQALGARVVVRRKNGSTSTETLRSVVRKIGELWFYGIR